MEKLVFNPVDGFNDSANYPDPANETETREQLQSLHNQTRDFINNSLIENGAGNIATTNGETVQESLDHKINSEDIKAQRINGDGAIEYSRDGVNWQAGTSSGHIIENGYGDQFPQRTRLQFLNTTITDDGTTTIVTGIKGDKGDKGDTGPQGPIGQTGSQGETGPQGQQGVQGPKGDTGASGINGRDGNSFVVRGRFNTYAELVAVYPSGEVGWAYAVGTADNNVVYNWDVEIGQWVSLGKLQGPAGPSGPQGSAGPQGEQGIQGVAGPQGIQGPAGQTGPTGPTGPQGARGEGVPAGGVQGQVLAKNSDVSYDTSWIAAYTQSEIDNKFETKTAHTTDINSLKNTLEAEINSTTVSATLLLASWTGTEAPYTYSLTVSGVTTTSNQDILPALNITSDQLEKLQGANIQDGGQTTNKITLKAYGDKPTVNLPIRIILRGTK